MTVSSLFVILRLVVNCVAAGGAIAVARRLGRRSASQYMRYVLYGTAFYNSVAGMWFFATHFGVVSPSPFWFSHVYTLANMAEAIAVTMFALYTTGKIGNNKNAP